MNDSGLYVATIESVGWLMLAVLCIGLVVGGLIAAAIAERKFIRMLHEAAAKNEKGYPRASSEVRHAQWGEFVDRAASEGYTEQRPSYYSDRSKAQYPSPARQGPIKPLPLRAVPEPKS